MQEEIRSMGKGRRKRGTCDFDETMSLLSKDCNGRFSSESAVHFLRRINKFAAGAEEAQKAVEAAGNKEGAQRAAEAPAGGNSKAGGAEGG